MANNITFVRNLETPRVSTFSPNSFSLTNLKKDRRYIRYILAITFVYLMVEISFVSFLVDMFGKPVEISYIERVEHVGRLISAFAFSLAIFGLIFSSTIKRFGAVKASLLCFFVFSMCMGSVYFGQKLLVDEIVRTSSPYLRQQAAKSVALREEMYSPNPSIPSIPVPEYGTGDDAWNAFIGLFPFISLYDPGVLSLSSKGAVDAANFGAAAAVPSFGEFKKSIIPDLISATEKRYDAYRSASVLREDAGRKVNRDVENGWNKHWSNMEKHRMVGPRANNRSFQRNVDGVRRTVQRNGVPVPNNWNPTDKATFQRAAFNKHLAPIDEQYNKAISRIFGDGFSISPNLNDLSIFMNNDSVQKHMASELFIEKNQIVISRHMTDVDIQSLYARFVPAYQKRLQDSYFADPKPYSRGGKLASVGEAAMKSLIVPPLAIILSLFGTFIHIVKVINYTLSYIYLRKIRSFNFPAWGRGAIASVFVFLPIFVFYTPASAVVEMDYFKKATAHIDKETGMPVSKLMEVSISLQNLIAPVGDVIRYSGIFYPLALYIDSGNDQNFDNKTVVKSENLTIDPIYASIEGRYIRLPTPRPLR